MSDEEIKIKFRNRETVTSGDDPSRTDPNLALPDSLVQKKPETDRIPAHKNSNIPSNEALKLAIPKHSADASNKAETELDRIEKQALLKIQMLERDLERNHKKTPLSSAKQIQIGCLVILAFSVLLTGFFSCRQAARFGEKPPGNEQNQPGENPLARRFVDREVMPVIQPHMDAIERAAEQAFGTPPKQPPPVPAQQQPEPNAAPENEAPEHDPATLIESPPDETEPTTSPEQNFQTIKTLLESLLDDEPTLRRALARICKLFPNDVTLHGKVITLLLRSGRADLVESVYSDWLKNEPDAFAANMIAALVLDASDELRIKHLKQACLVSLATPSPEPYFLLVNLYKSKRQWNEAAAVCESMALPFPNLEEPHRLRARFAVFGGSDPQTEFLRLQKLVRHKKKHEQAIFLLPFAQDFLPFEQSDNLLHESGLKQENKPEFQRFLLRDALIRGKKLPPSDLELQGAAAREMLLLYFISHSDNVNAWRINTPPHLFPDFYKILLSWLTKDDNLPIAANAYLNASRFPDPARDALCRFFLGKISADELRTNIDRFDPEEEPLVYFVLATHALRKKSGTTTAEILFLKAAKNPRTIYKTLLETSTPKPPPPSDTKNP